MKPTIQSATISYSGPVLALATTTALLTGALVIAPVIRPAQAQAVSVLQVDVKEVAKGWRASKLRGADVQNAAGEDIGEIDDLIITKDKVAYAILDVGGFLGLGGHLVAVPFDSLQVAEDGSKVVLKEGTKEQLQQMPEFKYPS